MLLKGKIKLCNLYQALVVQRADNFKYPVDKSLSSGYNVVVGVHVI